MPKLRSIVPTACLILLVHGFLFGFYLFTCVNVPNRDIYLHLRRYIPCALAVVFAIRLWQRAKLPIRKLWTHAAVSLFWMFTYPLCYWIPYHRNSTVIDNHYDIAIAAYLFCSMVCLHLLLLKFLKKPAVVAGIMGVLQTVLMVVPVVQLWYYKNYSTPVSPAACLALLQTNASEAREYFLANIGYGGGLGIAFLFLCLAVLLIRGNRWQKAAINLSEKSLLAVAVVLLATGAYSVKTFPRTGVLNAFRDAQYYLRNAALFNEYRKNNLKHLQVIPPARRPEKPSTVILVIGESASRHFMSAYRKTERDNTPWMRTAAAGRDFILFRHAYSSCAMTVPALEYALTEKNQYNKKAFNRSFSILDVAKKAGYVTWWFSNQGMIAGADTPITLVAKTADHSCWLEDTRTGGAEKKYDRDLLSFMKQVDPAKNNFIVLHIMGSHENYATRYPPEFARWKDSGGDQRVLEYDNSLAYTDTFLEDLHTYGVRELNLQAMLYFSDHGANPLIKRHPEFSGFISRRIPLFIYLSPEYQTLYPETAAALRSHADSYFTNDLIYELTAGLLHIKSNHYDESGSLASPKYKFTRKSLKTSFGKTSLTEDTEEGDP